MFYWFKSIDKKANDPLKFHIATKEGKCLCGEWVKGTPDEIVVAKNIKQPRLLGETCSVCVRKFLESL